MPVATAMRTRPPRSSLCRPASALALAPPGRWPWSSPASSTGGSQKALTVCFQAWHRRSPLQVAEPARLLLGHGHGDWVFAEVGYGVADVAEQEGGQVAADALADQDALDGDVRGRSGEGVGGYLPAGVAEPVGQVEERVAGVLAVADPPGDGRDPGVGVAVTQQVEGTQLGDLGGEVLADVVARGVDAAVAVVAEPDEVVVAGDDLPGRAGEVDLEHRHVAAQVVDVEHQIFGQFAGVAPDDPAHAQGSQPELVPGGADRLDPGQAEE